jgi:hypothetical protein
LTADVESWQLEVNSARELQLKGASQCGQLPFDTVDEEATLLKPLPSNVKENTALCAMVTCGV